MYPPKAEYLGDGVYASYDGLMIVLDLRGQDNTTRIVLEPETWDNLVRFAKREMISFDAEPRSD